MTKVKQISDFQKINSGYNTIEYATAGRVYSIDGGDVNFAWLFGENVQTNQWGDTDTFTDIECLSDVTTDSEVADIIRYYHSKATDITVEYLELVAEQSATRRKRFMSEICKNAWSRVKKYSLRWGFALRQAYEDARVALATIVEFFKVSTGEITVRKVKFIQMLADGRYLFQDLDKNAPISFNPYQLLSFQ